AGLDQVTAHLVDDRCVNRCHVPPRPEQRRKHLTLLDIEFERGLGFLHRNLVEERIDGLFERSWIVRRKVTAFSSFGDGTGGALISLAGGLTLLLAGGRVGDPCVVVRAVWPLRELRHCSFFR